MNVLILSRTNWLEAPRLRHQFSKMFHKRGHKVSFIEKPVSLFRAGLTYIDSDTGIEIIRHREICHHQLKPLYLQHQIYSLFAKYEIKKLIGDLDYDLIINFNYDYNFLNKLFPSAKIITVINDDFEKSAKFWMRRQVTKLLSRTCAASDHVLCVSQPLLDRALLSNTNSSLFLPWAVDGYQKPIYTKNRSVVLYYGYINNRLDWSLIRKLVESNVNLRFVGPVEGEISSNEMNELSSFDNFEYIPSTEFSDLFLDDVCCSIAPYNKRLVSRGVVTVGNRVFQLLSRGIPIIYPPFEYLIDSSDNVIHTASDYIGYLGGINKFQENFQNIQPEIERFLTFHSEDIRFQYLLDDIL